MRRTMARVIAIALAAWISGEVMSAQAPAASQTPPAAPSIPAAIDKIFERWDRPHSAGCAVGVARNGAVVYTRGYGMANLEHGVRIRPDTIFESGSVAKQFTAAAVVLLALDGKLSLDDPVRKYVPELPDFGTPILIRHFLSHTSGLRSQWPMLAIEGRPPGRAVHTIEEILQLVSGYKELNRTFAIDTKGAGGGVRLTENGSGQSKPRVWEREPPFEPTPQQLTQFAGDYVCEELGGFVYSVHVEGAALQVRARPAQRFTLAPLFPDAFTGEGQMIRFTRDAKGRVEGFRVYAGRVRNLRFAKRS